MRVIASDVLMDIYEMAQHYNKSDFTVINKINTSRGDDDKRFTYLIRFDDGQELAIKVCSNNFTTHERVSAWKKLCKHYADIGIYCPQIVNNLNGKEAETIIFENEAYILYAEEMKKYKTLEEFDPRPSHDGYKDKLIESIGVVAANNKMLFPWPSPYCVFVKFCETSTTDENYESGKFFCDTIKEHFPRYDDYANSIWDAFIEKRKQFEPVYYTMPKAVFQADLNGGNVLLDDNMDFAGLIDFNLSGTESILCYILYECHFPLDTDDLEQLNDEKFLKKCDDYLFANIKKINKHYTFTPFEKDNFNLCYNTVFPFCCLMITGMLKWVIRENKGQHIEKVLDWVYHQLTRNDLDIDLIMAERT